MHADIFFFVTTIAVVFISILAVIALYYAIRILKDIDEVSKKAKVEANEIIDDMHVLRSKIKTRRIMTAGLIGLAVRFFKRIF